MRVSITAGAASAVALAGALGAMAFTQGGPHAGVPTSVNLTSASSPPGLADQAALTYVEGTYPGHGTAVVLKTEADTEKGVTVYDVKVEAPNGSTYSLSIRASNDAVLSAKLSETQGAQAADSQQTPDAKQTPEPTDTPDAQQTPEPTDTPDAKQAPEPSATTSSDGAGSTGSDT